MLVAKQRRNGRDWRMKPRLHEDINLACLGAVPYTSSVTPRGCRALNPIVWFEVEREAQST